MPINDFSYFVEPLETLISSDEQLFDVLKNNFNSVNSDIEQFIKEKAIQAIKLKSAMTFLVFDTSKNIIDLVGYFTLSIKVLRISEKSLSKSEQKHIKIFSYYDEHNKCFNCPAFLIAQFGKNFNSLSVSISGSDLMNFTLQKILEAQKIIGGKLAFLECEKKEKLLNFYKEQGFKLLNSYDDKKSKNGKELLQLYRII